MPKSLSPWRSPFFPACLQTCMVCIVYFSMHEHGLSLLLSILRVLCGVVQPCQCAEVGEVKWGPLPGSLTSPIVGLLSDEIN
jgi:hypothetical protein